MRIPLGQLGEQSYCARMCLCAAADAAAENDATSVLPSTTIAVERWVIELSFKVFISNFNYTLSHIVLAVFHMMNRI